MLFSKSKALLSLLAAQATAVNFMPLGDSITEITCWRAYVWGQISAAGLAGDVDFVGSMGNNPQNCRAQSPGFDVNHEGHSGWQAVDIANNYLQGWLSRTPADVVQFMLGTNDVNGGKSTDQIIAAYTRMVELMRASNPRTKIIVDKVIPLSFNQGPIDALNARIPAWAQGLSTEESPIYVADCSKDAGFTNGMLRDGIHPNDQGDQLIAAQVGPLAIQAIEDVLAGV